MSDLDNLLLMGFTRELAEKALSETSNTGIETAIEWISNNQSKSIDSETPKDQKDVLLETAAKSMICSNCQKVFSNTDEMQFHASKTGHSNFEESTETKKPLTKEEKEEKLKQIKERLKEKKLEKEKAEKERLKNAESMRRSTGKEITEAKELAKEKAIKNAIEQRKKEKKEEELARQRVKQQIEMDKLERSRKKENNNLKADTATAESQKNQVPRERKALPNSTRIQFKFVNSMSPPIVRTYQGETIFKEVYDDVANNMQNNHSQNELVLSIPFPRKTFTSAEFKSTLIQLNLVPSAVILVSHK